MATVHPQTSFLTLPPEIRLSIYRLLFDGQLLRIRSSDNLRIRKNKYLPHDARHDFGIRRDRSKGLNIMFACRLCLQEARPVLLDTATFDFALMTISRGAGTLQGFATNCLSKVRSARWILEWHFDRPLESRNFYESAHRFLPGLVKLEFISTGYHRCCVHREWNSESRYTEMTFNELEGSGALRALKALVASDVPFDEELNAMFLYAKKKGRNRASLCVMYEVTTADSVRVVSVHPF